MKSQRAMTRIKNRLQTFLKEKNKIYISLPIAFIGLIYLFSKYADSQIKVFRTSSEINFSGGRVLDNRGRDLYKRKERVFSKKFKTIETRFKSLDEKFYKVNESLEVIKDSLKAREEISNQQDEVTLKGKELPIPTIHNNGNNEVAFHPTDHNIQPGSVPRKGVSHMRNIGPRLKKNLTQAGPSIVSFPVESKGKEEMSVKIPSGSFVKAKLLTGVEAPEGKAIPVLLQADYAFIGPNKSRIDLTGCFFIAKSSGNLSIERVEMQVTKISCVSKTGRMFDRKINGFVADAKDNSFAVMGKVNSKQSRVAAMAFLSSVVEGVGKSIQQVQTTTENTARGITSMISGSQGKYMVAGGAGNAASQVTQWYLQHAQNLLPTINIGSGQDIWLIVQDTVALPSWYFKKTKKKSSAKGFSYLTRFIEN